MTQAQRRLLLIQSLLKEKPAYRDLGIPAEPESQRQLLRGLLNLRVPQHADADFLQMQDAYLQGETAAKVITDIADLTPIQPGLYLWQGDITTLKCDAIVNAANSGMTGCYIPNHRCIDNAIHSAAGIQLRNECAQIMEAQGHEEPTGKAKITKGYNLPAKHVIHTVGPIVGMQVTEKQEEELKSCYLNCMKLAEKEGLKSIAFCCISTGEFHFPNKLAAEIAVKTVDKYLSSSKLERVIFNVFKEEDYNIYKKIFA